MSQGPAVIREPDFTPVMHPVALERGGLRLWVEPEVQEIVHKLHYGDAVVGWEGDPRMALYLNEDNKWLLVRWSPNPETMEEEPVPVLLSRPDVPIGGLIRWLVEHDCRNGHDVMAELKRRRATREAEANAESKELIGETVDRLAFSFSKNFHRIIPGRRKAEPLAVISLGTNDKRSPKEK